MNPVLSANITSDASQLLALSNTFEKSMYDRLVSDINKHNPDFRSILIYYTPASTLPTTPLAPPNTPNLIDIIMVYLVYVNKFN